VLDLSGQGVNFDNLWSGPGIPFGGSLIMMSLDIILYGLLAYYLDCVIPSRLYYYFYITSKGSVTDMCSCVVNRKHNIKSHCEHESIMLS